MPYGQKKLNKKDRQRQKAHLSQSAHLCALWAKKVNKKDRQRQKAHLSQSAHLCALWAAKTVVIATHTKPPIKKNCK